MSEEQAEYVTEAVAMLGQGYEHPPVVRPLGFQSPNYTQVPNDLFDGLMCEMGNAELRVVLAIVRQTIGYHREMVKFSIPKLKEMTGLSRNGVREGAEAAEARGLIVRLNPQEQGSAEWGLVVTPSASEGGSASEGEGGQPVTPRGSASDPQVGLNKDKESRNKKDINSATEQIFIDHFRAFNGNRERSRWNILAEAVGLERAEQIAAWAERKEVHMTNRGGLLDSMETAANGWTEKKKPTKSESFLERLAKA